MRDQVLNERPSLVCPSVTHFSRLSQIGPKGSKMGPKQTFLYLFQICFFCNFNCTNSMKLENHKGRD